MTPESIQLSKELQSFVKLVKLNLEESGFEDIVNDGDNGYANNGVLIIPYKGKKYQLRFSQF